MLLTEKTDIRDSDEKVVEIEMERLRNFTNHPFKVIGDSQMIELQESIKKYGILNPLIVRPKKDGCYEIISGHRRKFAAEKIGYRKVPVIIRVLKDDEAVVSMVDSNLHFYIDICNVKCVLLIIQSIYVTFCCNVSIYLLCFRRYSLGGQSAYLRNTFAK